MWVMNVKANNTMASIEGAIEGQNDHMVSGVVIALHVSMLKKSVRQKIIKIIGQKQLMKEFLRR